MTEIDTAAFREAYRIPAVHALCDALDEARAALDRVRAVHTTEYDDLWCDRCEDSYPCATIRALATPAPADAEDGGR